MRRWLILVALLGLSTSCSFDADVEPTPLLGDAPQTVAIWPFAAGGQPPDSEVWFTGLAYQLGRRGYRVIAPGVSRELLLGSDLAVALEDVEAVGRALAADAVLHVDVRAFESRGEGSLREASWDVAWRLVSTRGQGQQWAHVAHGAWHMADRERLESALGFEDIRGPLPPRSIGGPRVPSFRDVAELLAHLHREAMARLPERADS